VPGRTRASFPRYRQMSAVMTSLSIPSFGTKYSFVRTEAAARLLSRSLSVSLLDILNTRRKMDVGRKKGSPETGKRCKASTPRQPWRRKGMVWWHGIGEQQKMDKKLAEIQKWCLCGGEAGRTNSPWGGVTLDLR
jgi:hypothetical protein